MISISQCTVWLPFRPPRQSPTPRLHRRRHPPEDAWARAESYDGYCSEGIVPPAPLPPPLVTSPVPPRLHLHNTGLENAAYSIGMLQGHASSPADSEFKHDHPIHATLSDRSYQFGSHLRPHSPFHHHH
jgi:hypothetical protein